MRRGGSSDAVKADLDAFELDAETTRIPQAGSISAYC
jgi:hypothetical protein